MRGHANFRFSSNEDRNSMDSIFTFAIGGSNV